MLPCCRTRWGSKFDWCPSSKQWRPPRLKGKQAQQPEGAAKMWARRGVVGRLVFLVWAALCVFGARAYSQTGLGETLSGPDSHERRQGADGYLLVDWGGERTRLL